jgi:hypothetical protein
MVTKTMSHATDALVLDEQISPELVLVDPELARRARAALPPVYSAHASHGQIAPLAHAPAARAPGRGGRHQADPAGPPANSRATHRWRLAAGVAALLTMGGAAVMAGLARDGSPARASATFVDLCRFPDGACAVQFRTRESGSRLADGDGRPTAGSRTRQTHDETSTAANSATPAAPSVAAARLSKRSPIRVAVPSTDAAAPATAADPEFPSAPSPRTNPPDVVRGPPPPAIAWQPVPAAQFYRVRVSQLVDAGRELRVEAYPAASILDVGSFGLPAGRYVWQSWGMSGTRAKPVQGPRLAEGTFVVSEGR